MPYSTVGQVQSEFKDLSISSTSIVKTADVEEYVAESDAEINSRIGRRYVVPVTTGDALVMCRRMSRALAADRVAARLGLTTTIDRATQTGSARMSRKEALEMADAIAEGKLAFPGAVAKDARGGVHAYSGENDVERTFTLADKQW